MKNNLRTILTIAALGLIFAFAGNARAQQDMPQPQIAGGYGAVSITDNEVVAAANFAVKAEAKKTGAKIRLISINQAERQVVAGMNYKLCLNVETRRRGKKTAATQIVQTVVYENLKQKYSLTSWTAGGRACT